MVRLRGIPDEKFNPLDSTMAALHDHGYKNVCKWILKYTGTSNDNQTEISAPTAAWDGALEEVTTVAFKTKALSIGSEYLKIPFSAAAGGSTGTEHYFYYDTNEITTVTCLALTDCVANSSFHFWVDNGAGCETEYYCWMKVDGEGADPSESGTAIECDISGATTAIQVAEVIDSLIDAKDGVGCDNGGTATLPIINANNGNVTDISDGDLATGFTWTIESGGDDPNRAGCCTITCDTKNNTTAEATFHFFVADGSGGETEYYLWMNVAGTDSDPVESGTAIECDISGIGTAIEVAEVIDGLINALTDVACDNGGTAALPIINANAGSVTDPYDGITVATSYAFIFQDGTLDSGASGTAHSSDISGATSAADVGTIIVALVDAVAGLSATGTATMTVESDNTGDIDDVSQSGSSFGTITKVRDGAASYGGGYLYIVSASADDTDAADKDCREVTLIGFDTDGLFATDTIKMAGATFVKTAVQFKRISHIWGSKFGSADNDAKGDITVETSNTANCTALLTITAATTESGGAHIYVPDGQYLLMEDAKIFNITNANTGATYVTMALIGFEDSTNLTPDYDSYIACVQDITHQASDINPSRQVRVGSDTASVICSESEVGIVGNEDFVFVLELYTFTD